MPSYLVAFGIVLRIRWDQRSCAFLTPGFGSRIRNKFFCGSRILDPGVLTVKYSPNCFYFIIFFVASRVMRIMADFLPRLCRAHRFPEQLREIVQSQRQHAHLLDCWRQNSKCLTRRRCEFTCTQARTLTREKVKGVLSL
jgi:hypothetical protein